MDPKEDRPPPEGVEHLSDLDRALETLRAQRNAAQAELELDGATQWLLPDLGSEEDTDENVPTDADLAPGAVDATPAELDELDDRYETLDDPRIPDGQSYFKIGEVAKIIGVKPYVLRYWEGEFPWVRPEKTSSRQRRYRRQDVAMLLTIRRLRHDEQLTIARTRELIQDMKKSGRKRPQRSKRPMRVLPDEAPAGVDPALLRRRLGEMRQALMELLSAVEE
jgi:DNA-binding transcriptional MerR regulator